MSRAKISPSRNGSENYLMKMPSTVLSLIAVAVTIATQAKTYTHTHINLNWVVRGGFCFSFLFHLMYIFIIHEQIDS